ncbi:hypothetical protein CC2G_001846 [Coprinopsis cinerea AmutBmut pab1-1]|nr:hypothetical protein CC2G_001846 [Coprinopsis cinerea AmutBmut pab1-1]
MAQRPSVPIAIIGNYISRRRQVSLEEAEALAQGLKCRFLGEVHAIRDGPYSYADGTLESILNLYRDAFFGDFDSETGEHRKEKEFKGSHPMQRFLDILRAEILPC